MGRPLLITSGLGIAVFLLVILNATWRHVSEPITTLKTKLPETSQIKRYPTKSRSPIKVQESDSLIHSNAYNFSQNVRNVDQCVSGHIRNLPPICGFGGCLRTLSAPAAGVQVPGMALATRHVISSIHGWLSLIHIDMVWYLTQAQRHFLIWGSVGEIGVYYGKFTALIANWIDAEAGERLFICDIFGEKKHMKLLTETANKEAFEANMQKLGFLMHSQYEKKLIRVWEDSSAYLSKSVFLDMNLPSFRFFSIDGNHNKPFILLDLLTVSCILRDGGIVAADDVGNPDWPDVRASLGEYFAHFGENILAPLALVHGKLYLVTENWHSKYMSWLEENGVPSKLQLRKITDKYFGSQFTYFKS